jgi:tRNA 2-selenouridine synthase
LSIQTISADQVLQILKLQHPNPSQHLQTGQQAQPQQPPSPSLIIDARSPDEYAHDHLPHAVNWPVLNNEERALVGTLYKQVNSFEAQKRGAALVAANIARHIEEHVLPLQRTWQPLLYCWRGGKRSGSLATVLSAIGFKVMLIEGGYKAFRSAVIEDMERCVQPLRFQVICGPTGSGKTRLLSKLREQGAQVLDLEAIAAHRSSVLGKIPGVPQPSQKAFETSLWYEMSRLDPTRIVFVESESRKIGNLNVPEPLIERMRASSCIDLQVPRPVRVQLLMDEYDFFVTDKELFANKLLALVALRGKELIERWHHMIQSAQVAQVVDELLELHYDPAYTGSISRNFVQFKSAMPAVIHDYSQEEFSALATQLIKDLNA